MKIMPLDSPDDVLLQDLAARTAERLSRRGWRLATAESCTGGWVAKLCTDLAGSSHWFDSGFVTYSNQAKQRMLGVRADALATHGAVSEAVVAQMVAGALANSEAEVALAISGIAGPGGGSDAKPVGMVCFAWGLAGASPQTATCRFAGEREAVRRQAVAWALEGVLARV